MKKIHIVLLILVAVCIAAVMSTISKSTTYADFKTANENVGSIYHVVGKLDRDKEMYYDPQKDPNYFTFFMKDSLGLGAKIIYRDTKPMDLEHSEKIVVVGEMNDHGDFEASEILKKCPSKYTDKQQAQN